MQLAPEEFFVVPRGVLKNPVADDQVGIVLIETATTAHSGANVIDSTVPIAPGRLR